MLDRPVRAEDHLRTRVHEIRPRVGGELSGLVDEVEEMEVGDAVPRPHRGGDVEFGEARNVLGLDELGVLDAVAQTPPGLLLDGESDRPRPLEDVEHVVVGLVADRVDRHGDTHLGRDPRLLEELVLAHLCYPVVEVGLGNRRRRAAVFGSDRRLGRGLAHLGPVDADARRLRFGIGRGHVARVRAERTVGEELDPTALRPVVPAAGHPPGLDRPRHLGLAEELRHPQILPTGLPQIVPPQRRGDSVEVVDAGESEREEEPLGRLEPFGLLLPRRFRDVAHEQIRGILPDQTSGHAVGSADDLTAGRVRGVVVDAGDYERTAVRPHRVQVDRPHRDRVVGDLAVEQRRSG